MPGAGFLRKAKVWRAKMEEFVDKPFQYVKDSMVSTLSATIYSSP